jgi:hypothetical protein
MTLVRVAQNNALKATCLKFRATAMASFPNLQSFSILIYVIYYIYNMLRILTWRPSGTTARLQGSHDSIWGTKGLSYLRPRCIGAERPRTHMQSNLTYIIYYIYIYIQ